MPFLRPGQGYKTFSVKKRANTLSASGKAQKGSYTDVGNVIGCFASITEKEIEQWKQKGHPVSHKIVQRGIVNVAKATNYLVLTENGTSRYFYVQGTADPGELHHMIRYFVEERKDLKDG